VCFWRIPCQCYRGDTSRFQMHPRKERSYNRSCHVQRCVVKFISDFNLKPVTLWNVEIKRKGELLSTGRTVFARIIGPGKVPEASVVLEHGEYWIRHRLEQQPRETHRREYPSGAICSLTMSREVLTITAETPPDRAARIRTKE